MFAAPTNAYLMTQSKVPFPFVSRNTCQCVWCLQSGAIQKTWRWGGRGILRAGTAEGHPETFAQFPRSSDTLRSPCASFGFPLRKWKKSDLWDNFTGLVSGNPDVL